MANLDEIKRVYGIIDENGDGVVSVGEISGFLTKLGIPISEQDLKRMFTSLCKVEDVNCSYVQFEQFEQLYESILISEDEGIEEESRDMREAFRVFDRNEDGYISSAELQQVLSSLGLIAQGEQCESMICKFDSDSNGVLDFMEFKNMMASKLSHL